MAAGETSLADVPKNVVAGHSSERLESKQPNTEKRRRGNRPDGVCVFGQRSRPAGFAAAERCTSVRQERAMKQEEMAPTELAKMTVVYSIPGVEAVTVRRRESNTRPSSSPARWGPFL